MTAIVYYNLGQVASSAPWDGLALLPSAFICYVFVLFLLGLINELGIGKGWV